MALLFYRVGFFIIVLLPYQLGFLLIELLSHRVGCVIFVLLSQEWVSSSSCCSLTGIPFPYFMNKENGKSSSKSEPQVTPWSALLTEREAVFELPFEIICCVGDIFTSGILRSDCVPPFLYHSEGLRVECRLNCSLLLRSKNLVSYAKIYLLCGLCASQYISIAGLYAHFSR